MNTTCRPTVVTTAILLLLFSMLLNLALPLLNRSSTTLRAFPGGRFADRPELNPSGAWSEGMTPRMGRVAVVIGYVSLAVSVAGAALSIVAMIGLWKLKKWGFWLAITLATIGLLGVLPGLLFSRIVGLAWPAIFRGLLALATLVLLLLPDARRAFQPAEARPIT